jgi:hypothetical protein
MAKETHPMDALYIVLLVFGVQAAAGALAMTAWLVRIAAMVTPRSELPVFSTNGSGLPSRAPASSRLPLTVLPGLEETVMVAGGRPPVAA